MGNCLVILKALPPPLSKGAPARVSGPDPDDELRAQKQHLNDVRVGDLGQLHRLFPSDVKAPSAAADPGAVMRVKLVISKQELRRMLGKDDQVVSLDDMVALMRRGSEDQQ